jgi:putative heme-binding domain-containing protein
VPALLEAAADAEDRAEKHAITFALIEIADADATAKGLKSWSPRVRQIAMTALDQMPKGALDASAVLKELALPDAALKETAWWIAARHPEWGTQIAKSVRQRLRMRDMSAPEREDWAKQLASAARAGAVQGLLAEELADPFHTTVRRRLALRAMADAHLKQAPGVWMGTLMGVLAEENSQLIPEGLATLRTLALPKNVPPRLRSILLDLARNARLAEQVRLDALVAMPGPLGPIDTTLFPLLRKHVGVEQSVAARTAASDVLARCRLTSEQLSSLADSFPSIGPMEINRLVETFGQSTDEHVGQRLLAVLKTSPARTALRREPLKAGFAKQSPSLRQQADELFSSLNADTAKQQARLEQLLASTHGGDIRRGQAVFNSTKAACSSCHAIGYLGGNIGPDLTHIARIRSDRDLLEAIVFPSASFVRGYEPVVVMTRDGKSHNGVIRRDVADELVLAVGANQEVRIARADIEEIQPSRVSVMPAGLEQQLTPGELADLLAFLKACK